MAKLDRDAVIATALNLLDDVGIDALSTRRLARRLGVESPALYWHFRDKAALLREMAIDALAGHRAMALPSDPDSWLDWFAANARSFRGALLARRDGARLHAGTAPGADDLDRLSEKVAFLARAGLPEREALMALLSVGQYTLGSVLEQQEREKASDMPKVEASCELETKIGVAAGVASVLTSGEDAAFEFGLSLFIDGLRDRFI